MNFIPPALFAAASAAIALGQPVPITVDSLVQKHLDALGGLKSIQAVQSTRATGKLIIGGGPVEAPFQSVWKRPNRTWISFTIQGQKIIEGFDGSTKWTVNPLMAPVPVTGSPEEAAQAAEEPPVVSDLLVDYKENGCTAAFEGRAEGNYRLKITTKSGRPMTVYLDAATYLISKVEKPGHVEMIPGNFKTVGAIKVPHSIEIRINGRSAMEMQIDSIELNAPAEDALFVAPGRK